MVVCPKGATRRYPECRVQGSEGRKPSMLDFVEPEVVYEGVQRLHAQDVIGVNPIVRP
jgi:hypothetical protein